MADRDEDPISYLTKHDPNDTISDAMLKGSFVAMIAVSAASGVLLLGFGIPMGAVWLFKWLVS